MPSWTSPHRSNEPTPGSRHDPEAAFIRSLRESGPRRIRECLDHLEIVEAAAGQAHVVVQSPPRDRAG